MNLDNTNLTNPRRRRHSPLEKKQIAEETYQAGSGASYVARQHGISPRLLYKWRQAMEDGALKGVECEDSVVSKKEIKRLKTRIRELETALARTSLDNEILKEAVKLGREKTDLATTLGRSERFRIRAITHALEISRSNLQRRLKMDAATQSRNYKFYLQDNEILAELKTIIEARASYGYRRVTALLNNKLDLQDKHKVNHKRIYRIMKENKPLLTKPARKATRTHEGKIITLNSNMRWCSDYFAIRCWD